MRIGIVTDTSSNITPETAKELGIHIVPLQVVIDGETYQDAFDITPEEFYEKMDVVQEGLKTSQPAIGEFIKLYQEIEDQYDKIISIHPSQKLSKTVETAMIASSQVNPEKITVFDSELVSVLTGYLVVEAKRLAHLGKSLEVIKNRMLDMKSKIVSYITLNNYEDIISSGRLPQFDGNLSNITQIKPIIKISSVGLELQRFVRTSKRAIEKVEELTYEYLDTLPYPARIDVAHGNIMEEAQKSLHQLLQRYPEQESQIYQLASVMGAHTGPNIIGFTIAPVYTDE